MADDTRLLVFGDDGSPTADVAWLWCNDHHWPGWRVEVVTATPPEHPATATGSPAMREWQPPWGRELLRVDGISSVRFLEAIGDPRVVLDDRHDADLLVVGTQGLGRIRAFWMGSTAEWLLHHPPAPLVLIRTAAVTRRVVVCADGSVHARRAVEAFVLLPLAAQTDVVLLGVDDGRADVGGGIEELAALLAGRVARVEHRVQSGKPTDAILDVLGEVEAHLVVLGTRGLTGFKSLRVGSTASEVARAAACNVLLACVDGESG